MQQFIDNLIGRLEGESYLTTNDDGETDKFSVQVVEWKDIKEIVNQLAEEYKGGWIPCSERLPEEWMIVYATCISLIDNRNPWVIEGTYFSGCGGFERMTPMLEYGDAEVIAWMPKKYPEPYQKEGE